MAEAVAVERKAGAIWNSLENILFFLLYIILSGKLSLVSPSSNHIFPLAANALFNFPFPFPSRSKRVETSSS